jgi:hypothetical protein
VESGTRALIGRLQDSINRTLDALAGLSDADLDAACSHGCARGPGGTSSIYHLLANDIDHETMHAGQILSLRHDLGEMQSPVARLLGEWLTKRAALAGALVGLADEALDRRLKPGEWTIREVVEHTLYWESDSIQAGLRELASGERWHAGPDLDYGGPVPVSKSRATSD